MSKYSKYFSNNSQAIDPWKSSRNLNYKTSYKTSMVNTRIEEVNVYRKLNIIDMHTELFKVIDNLNFDVEIFRKAYINQRKQYKLLKAYLDLTNELITDDEYDMTEDKCAIVLKKHNEEITQKVLYQFLKKHRDYVENYTAHELSEILGLQYKTVSQIIKKKNKQWQTLDLIQQKK